MRTGNVMDGREDEEIERIRSRIAALEAERVELEAALAEGVRRPLAA